MTKLSVVLLVAGLGLFSLNANAALYTFSQTGFEENAFISGSFEGVDSNDDGILQGGFLASVQEISAFSMTFSGNSIVPVFSHAYSDLTYLGFRLTGNATLGEGNPEGLATRLLLPGYVAPSSGYTYNSGVYGNGQNGAGIVNWNADSNGFIYTESPNLVSVNAVPVPGTVWLFGSAVAGFLGLKRRKA